MLEPTRMHDFHPPPLLGGPHVQTLLGKALRPRPAPAMEKVRMELEDGDFLDLSRSVRCRDGARPIVLVLHGLEGSVRRRYMLMTFQALVRHGLAPIGMNFRGCSGEPNRLPRAYHSGDTEDVSRVLDHIREQYPGRPIGLVGFSLGANVALKLLGERQDPGAGPPRRESGVDAAVAISVPFDLSAGALELERPGIHWIYRTYFLRSLREKVLEKKDLLLPVIDVHKAAAARTIREFDDIVTAPLHGFSGAQDYYDRSSAGQFLADIVTPTLIIHSIDDPFLPRDSIPTDVLLANESLTVVLLEGGGHVGFVSTHPDERRFWAEETSARYLASKLIDGFRADHEIRSSY